MSRFLRAYNALNNELALLGEKFDDVVTDGGNYPRYNSDTSVSPESEQAEADISSLDSDVIRAALSEFKTQRLGPLGQAKAMFNKLRGRSSQ